MNNVFDDEKKSAIIRYCNFAFNQIYGDSDQFTAEDGKDINSIVAFLQSGCGENWLKIINFSCNTSFSIKSKIRRFNLVGPSDYIMKTFNIPFTYTLDVLFRLMEVHIFKTPDIEQKMKFIKSVFQIVNYNPNQFADGKNFIQIIKKLYDVDTSEIEDTPKSRYDFIYDFLKSKNIKMLLDKDDFKNIYKSETLLLLHLTQLLDLTESKSIDLSPEKILFKSNQIIKSLFFCEAFYFRGSDVFLLKAQKIDFEIDISYQTVKMTQIFEIEEGIGEICLLKSKNATLFLEDPLDHEITEIFPNDCLYQAYSIGDIQKFTISATNEIKIEMRDIKTLGFKLFLDSFYPSEADDPNLIQFSLSFEAPFKMEQIKILDDSYDSINEKIISIDFETSEKILPIEIIKTPKVLEEEMQFCGLGYLTIDDFEYCIIKKIEFNGNFEEYLQGVVKIKFMINLENPFPVYYHFPPTLSSIVNVLCDLTRIEKKDKNDDFFFLGRLRPKVDHELRLDIQLPGESVEDEWLANLPISANFSIKPDIDIKVINRNMHITAFPDQEYIKVAIPLKFDPATDLDQIYTELFDQISMGTIVFVRQQKLFPCDIIESTYYLNLDTFLLQVTKTAIFDAPIEKEIYFLTENNEKNMNNEDENFLDDKFEIIFNSHVREIHLENKDKFRAFTIGKMKPNEPFTITSQKKINVDISDVHFFKFTLFFDTLKVPQKLTYRLRVSSDVYQFDSITVGETVISCKNEKTYETELETTDHSSDITVTKYTVNILKQMTSRGNGYLSVDNFELWPIKRIEFIGTFTNLLKGEMKIIFDETPYNNPHFYHPNEDTEIDLSKFECDSDGSEKDTKKKNVYPLSLDHERKEHEISFELKMNAEMGEDCWDLQFPLTHYKYFDDPSFSFQIEEKQILIERMPFTDTLDVKIGYDIKPQTLIQQWPNIFTNISTFYAFYFDKFNLVPCELISWRIEINLNDDKFKTTKVFRLSSMNKKMVYVLANPDSQISWKKRDFKIEVDDVPFDAYSIGSFSPDNNINFVSYNDFSVDKSVSYVTFLLKNDISKKKNEIATISIQSDFPIKAVQYSDQLFESNLSCYFEFKVNVSEEEVKVIVFKKEKDILDELRNKNLGYFTINKFDLLETKEIIINSNFDEGQLKGQIEYKVKGTNYNDDVYFHVESEKLHLTNLRVDSEEQKMSHEEDGTFKIGKLELIPINEEEEEDVERSYHSVLFDFTLDAEMGYDTWEIVFPITRYATLNNPKFHFGVQNKSIEINTLPINDIHLSFPLTKDSVSHLKSWNKVFNSIYFGSAVYLHQLKLVACGEVECGSLQVNLIEKTIVMKRNFKLPDKFKKEVFIIASKEADVKYSLRLNKIEIDDGYPYNVFSIGQRTSNKNIQVSFHRKLSLTNYSVRINSFAFGNDFLIDTEANPNAAKVILSLISSFKKIGIQIDDEEIEEGIEIDKIEKEIPVDKEETKVTIYNEKEEIDNEIEVDGFGYFTIGKDFRLLRMKDINITSNFSGGKIEGEIHIVVEGSPFDEDIYFHSKKNNKIKFNEMIIDGENIEITREESDKEEEEIINIGETNKINQEHHIEIPFIIESEMKGNSWEFEIPITRMKDANCNPEFSFIIENESIKINDLPQEEDKLTFNISIPDEPEKNLINWTKLFSFVSLGQSCFFYQSQPYKCQLISTIVEIDLVNNLLHSTKRFLFPEDFGERRIYFLIGKNFEIENAEHSLFQEIHSDLFPFRIFKVGFINPGEEVKLRTLQKLKVEDKTVVKKSFILENDVILNELKKSTKKRRKKSKKKDEDPPSKVYVEIASDSIIQTVSFLGHVLDNPEEEVPFLCSYQTNDNEIEFNTVKIIGDILAKLDVKDLGYFTVGNFELLQIRQIVIRSTFDRGRLDGVIEFKVEGCPYDEDIFYYPGVSSVKVSNMRIDSEPVVGDDDEERMDNQPVKVGRLNVIEVDDNDEVFVHPNPHDDGIHAPLDGEGMRTSDGEHPTGDGEHPTVDGEHPEGDGEHPEGDGEHPTGDGEHSEGDGEHPEGDGEHPTVDGEHPEGDGEHPTVDGEHPEGDGEHPEGDGEHPTGDGEHPEGDGEHPEGDGEHPEGDGEHPEGDGEHPEGDGEHPTVDGEHPEGDGEHPEGDGEHPTGDGEHPEGDGEHPEGDGEHPEGDGEHPEGDGEHPEGDGEHPEGDGEHPEGDGEHPTVDGEHPTVDGEHPEGDGEHPTVDGEHPTVDGEHPEGDGEHPEGDGEHPEGDGEHPEGDGEHPEGDGEHPEGDGEHPEGDGEHPEGDGEHPEGDGEHPEGDGEHPEGDGEHPEGDGEHPEGDGEHPEGDGEHPTIDGEHPTIDGEHPTIDGEHPEGDGEHPEGDGEHPTVDGEGGHADGGEAHSIGDGEVTHISDSRQPPVASDRISRCHSVAFDFQLEAETTDDTWEIDFPITRYTNDNPSFLFEIDSSEHPVRIDKLPYENIHISIPIVNNPSILLKDWRTAFQSLFFGYAVCLHQLKVIPCEEIESGKVTANLGENTITMERKFKLPIKLQKEVFIIASKDAEIQFSSDLNEVVVDDIPYQVFSIGPKNREEKFSVQFNRSLLIDDHSIIASTFTFGNDLLLETEANPNAAKIFMSLISSLDKIDLQIDDEEIEKGVVVSDLEKEIPVDKEETKVTIYNEKEEIDNEIEVDGFGYFTIGKDFRLLRMKDINITSNFSGGKIEGEIHIVVEGSPFDEDIYFHSKKNNKIKFNEMIIDGENIEITREESDKEEEEIINIGETNKINQEHHIEIPFIIESEMKGNSWKFEIPITRMKDANCNPEFSFIIENESIKINDLPQEEDKLTFNISIPDEPEKNLINWTKLFSFVSLGQSCFFYQSQPYKCQLISTTIEVDLTQKVLHSTKEYKMPKDYGERMVYFLIGKDFEIENEDHESFKKIDSDLFPFDIFSVGYVEPGKKFWLKTTQKLDVTDISINQSSFVLANDVILNDFKSKKLKNGKRLRKVYKNKDVTPPEQLYVHLESRAAIAEVTLGDDSYENQPGENSMNLTFQTNENNIEFIVKKGSDDILNKLQQTGLGYFTADDFELLKIDEINIESTFDKGVLTGNIEFKVEGTEYDIPVYYYSGMKSVELNGLSIDSNPVEIAHYKDNENKIEVGTLSNDMIHTVTFSFKMAADVNDDQWQISFPVTRYTDDFGGNPSFSFEEKSEKIQIDELPDDSFLLNFELIPDPQILLSLIDFSKTPNYTPFYLDHMKMEPCEIQSVLIDVDLNAKTIKFTRSYKIKCKDKGKHEVFILANKNDDDDIHKVIQSDIDGFSLAKFDVENVDFNAFSIGEQSSKSPLTFSTTAEIDVVETSIKTVEFNFLNDINSTFSMVVLSNFNMSQIQFTGNDLEIKIPCFNKSTVEITDQRMKEGLINCIIERTKIGFNDGLNYTNLGYFSIDDFCLLPIEKVEFIGESDDQLKGTVTFTLINDYKFDINVLYISPPFVKSVKIDNDLVVIKKNKKIIELPPFGSNETHKVSFDIVIEKELIIGEDNYGDDGEIDDIEKDDINDFIYLFPLTQFSTIKNPDFLLEIPEKGITVNKMPNAGYLEISLQATDLTLIPFTPEIDINMMHLIYLQGNAEFIGPVQKRSFLAEIKEMKATILCTSIYFNPSMYPVRYKIVFPNDFLETVNYVEINDKTEVKRESFSKIVDNDKYSVANLNRKIPPKSKFKIVFAFTAKVEEDKNISKISFRNEPLTFDTIYIPLSKPNPETASLVDELKKVISFDFEKNESSLFESRELPKDFTQPILEANFIYSSDKKVISQQISHLLNGTILFEIRQGRQKFYFPAKEVEYTCNVVMRNKDFLQEVTLRYQNPLGGDVQFVHCIYQDEDKLSDLIGTFTKADFLTKEENYFCAPFYPKEPGVYTFSRKIPMVKDTLSSKMSCSIPCDANTKLTIQMLRLAKEPIIKVRPEFLVKDESDPNVNSYSGYIQSRTHLSFKVYYEPNPLESLRIVCEKTNSEEAKLIFKSIEEDFKKLAPAFSRSAELKENVEKAIIGFTDSFIFQEGLSNSVKISKIGKVLEDFRDFNDALNIIANEGNVIIKDDTSKALELEIALFNSSLRFQKMSDGNERVRILPLYLKHHDIFKQNEKYISLTLPLNSCKNQILPYLIVRYNRYVIYLSSDLKLRNIFYKMLSPYTKVIIDNQSSVLKFKGDRMFAIFKPKQVLGLIKALKSKSEDEINDFISKTIFVIDDYNQFSNDFDDIQRRLVEFICSRKQQKEEMDETDEVDITYCNKMLRISCIDMKPINEEKIITETGNYSSNLMSELYKKKFSASRKSVRYFDYYKPYHVHVCIVFEGIKVDKFKEVVVSMVNAIMQNSVDKDGAIVLRVPEANYINEIISSVCDSINKINNDA
ncbi:hypothetical protein M9Y10_008442 [Tritrichomonas musculus]|uniref:Uncharacterized protein n=1 Tax=Tritrichomonas musculus TaxID=1915356 RepID=A0ABR2IY72_9EUKA